MHFPGECPLLIEQDVAQTKKKIFLVAMKKEIKQDSSANTSEGESASV